MAKVWEDLNANGIQDAGERGIAGATVTLFTDRNGDGQISANEVSEVGVTDATGEYIFTRNSGTLGQMTFTLPPGYDAASPRHVGANKSVDSDGPTTDLFRFGQSDPIASGFFKFAKLGDRVWNDTNADGIQDPGETGRAGVTVELYQATVDGEPGALVGTQTTDANGNYLFTQLTPGDYIVKFVAPDGTYISPPYVGIDNSINSDAEETSGRTAVYTLTSGQEELAVDMGLYVTTSVKDEVSLCEDRSATFNVLTNDIGKGLKLVDVSHESPELDSTFKSRGGSISFTPDGQVNYQSMTNYYGNDKLVYTFEDESGKRFTEVVDISVKPVSDAPDGASGLTYHPSGWEKTYNAGGVSHWVHGYSLSDFGTFADTADKLQQFGPYNAGTPDDSDAPAFVRLYGLTTNAATGTILYDGKPLDFSNGQTYDIPVADILAGKLDLDFFKAFVTYGLKFSWIDSGDVKNDACYDGSTVSTDGTVRISTPVALDLNGDGQIGVTGTTSSAQKDSNAELGRTVQFDIDSDGKADTVEWFNGSGDGILVDNRDGLAATQMNGARLFGDDNGAYGNGYDKLAVLDVNRDGELSGSELDGIAVWVDNGDAQVQAGEMRTLGEVGIASISTQMQVTVD